jgi:PAS domain S-box-containing protein
VNPRARPFRGPAENASGAARSIIVVEDNPITQKLIRTILLGAGYDVRVASDGATAVAEVSASRPDLVVQDLLLPDVDGVRLLERLRNLPGMDGVPVIACSGLVGSHEEARSLRAEFSDYVFKPVEPAVLLDVVARYVQTAPPVPRVGSPGPRVLLVDDDAVQRKLGKLVLERAGFQVTVSGGAEEALVLGRTSPPDVVLTDLLMPGMNGLDLCIAIRQDDTLANVPIILTSNTFGDIVKDDVETARQAGASDFVLRTAGFENVITALHKAVTEEAAQGLKADASTITHRYADSVVRQLERQGRLNVALSRRLARQTAQMAMMNAAAELLATDAPPHEVLEQILGRVLDATGASDGAVLVTENGDLKVAAHVGRVSTAAQHLVSCLRGSGLLDRVLGGETMVIPSGAIPSAVSEELTRVANAQCVVLAPLVAAGQVEGLLLISSSRPELGEDGAGSAQAIAVQLAQSLALAHTLERLRISEKNYRDLFEGAADAIVILNPDGRFVDANARATELVGRTLDELCDMMVTDLFVPEEAENVAKGFAAAREARHRTSERRLKRKDGGVVPVEISAKPLSDGRLHAILRDITRRKLAEGELLDRERQLEAIVQAVNDVVFEFDADGTYLSVWAADDNKLAAPRSELVGRRIAEVLGEAESAKLTPRFHRVIETGVPESFEYSLDLPDGEHHFLGRIKPLAGVGDSPDSVCMGIADITERRFAEQASRESEERFRLLAEHIKEAFFLVQLDSGRTLYLSPTFEEIWGFPVEEVYERPERWLEALHPDDQSAMTEALALNTTGAPWTSVFRIVRPDGGIRWARARAFPVPNANRLVGVVEDITEYRKVEEQAIQAQKMEAVGRLAGGVAHDFNNLLTVILAEVAYLLELQEGDSETVASLREVHKAGERASVLTRQLLAFSRRQLVEPGIFDLNEIVLDMEKMLRRLIGEDVAIDTSLAPKEMAVLVDRGQMEQILANLTVNARDAMPEGGTLRIETATVTLGEGNVPGLPPGGYVTLSIGDTGTGMTEEVRGRIFEPFFTTKGEGKGTGLGLATCYEIVRQAKGHIAVETEVGVGTTIRVSIPRAETNAQKNKTTGLAALPGGNETILLVEDEPAVRRVALRILRRLGYTVLEASGGDEAIPQIENHDVALDLLLTDVVMPRMSGREVAERARQVRPGLKVLFASGYTDDMIVQERLLEKDIWLIQKPLTPETLARRVREVLDAET